MLDTSEATIFKFFCNAIRSEKGYSTYESVIEVMLQKPLDWYKAAKLQLRIKIGPPEVIFKHQIAFHH